MNAHRPTYRCSESNHYIPSCLLSTHTDIHNTGRDSTIVCLQVEECLSSHTEFEKLARKLSARSKEGHAMPRTPAELQALMCEYALNYTAIISLAAK